MSSTRPLRVETLETRVVPALFGTAWPDARHLTFSFAPDNTTTIDGGSTLFAQLNQSMPSQLWQREILRAFQTWAVEADIDLGLVGDNGIGFGSAGAPQGAVGRGDIRIGNAPLTSTQLSVSTPFDLATDYAGDVVLNSAMKFGTGADAYDLFTVALQEAGHVLGLDNSVEAASVMYDQYIGARDGLSAGDITRIRTLYGSRSADAYDTAGSNQTLAGATRLTLPSGVVNADVTTRGDIDTYTFTASAAGSVPVSLRTAGVSLLVARLTVLDAAGNVVATASASNPGQGDLSLSISAAAGAKYYVQVEGAEGDVFGVGGYRLAVGANADSVLNPSASTLADPETNISSSFSQSVTVKGVSSVVDERSDLFVRSSLSSNDDVDTYQVVVPAAAAGVRPAMRINVWAMGVHTVDPRVTVYDSNGKVVSSKVVMDDTGLVSIQVTQVTPGKSYYVRVQNQDGNASERGDYGLNIDFQAKSAAVHTFADGTLSDTRRQEMWSFKLNEKRLYHFELSGQQGKGGKTALVMELFNSAGKIVYRTAFSSGLARQIDLWLDAGTYNVRFTAVSLRFNKKISSFAYELKGYARSDSVGLDGVDTTFQVVDTGLVESESTDTVVSHSADESYVWVSIDPTLYTGMGGDYDWFGDSWWY